MSLESTARTVNISVSNIEAAIEKDWLRPLKVVSGNEVIGPFTWGEIVKDPETGADVIPITFTVQKEVSTPIG